MIYREGQLFLGGQSLSERMGLTYIWHVKVWGRQIRRFNNILWGYIQTEDQRSNIEIYCAKWCKHTSKYLHMLNGKNNLFSLSSDCVLCLFLLTVHYRIPFGIISFIEVKEDMWSHYNVSEQWIWQLGARKLLYSGWNVDLETVKYCKCNIFVGP